VNAKLETSTDLLDLADRVSLEAAREAELSISDEPALVPAFKPKRKRGKAPAFKSKGAKAKRESKAAPLPAWMADASKLPKRPPTKSGRAWEPKSGT
jgi:hypothetical protein